MSSGVPDVTPDGDDLSLEGAVFTAFVLRSVIVPRRLQTVTGFLEELPIIYLQNGREQSPLHDATAACAFASYAIRHGCAAVLHEAHTAYDRAIVRLSRGIPDVSTRSATAAYVLAVTLAMFYEVDSTEAVSLHTHKPYISMGSLSCAKRRIVNS